MRLAFDDPQTQLRLQKALLFYLEKNGHIEDLVNVGKNYVDTLKVLREKDFVGEPLSLKIELDVVFITDISAELGSLICQEPIKAEILLEHLIMCTLQETAVKDLTGGLGIEQIYSPLRVSCLPKIKMQICRKQQGISSGLVMVRGMISAITTSTKYTRSCVVNCVTPLCPGTAKHRIRGLLSCGHSCCFCGVEKQEVPAEREVGEESVALLQPYTSLANRNTKATPIAVIFRDDLREELVLGLYFEVICRPVVHSRIPSCLLACSKPHSWEPGALVRACQLGTYALPSTLSKLQTAMEHSPWSFLWSVASQIGYDVLPQNTFLNLRLAVYLSLASQGSSSSVPLLICGGEHSLVSRLLISAAKLAPRCVIHGSQDSVGGTVRKSDEAEGACWVETGSLLLASQGICLLGDWHALKKEARNTTLACLETGQIKLQLPGQTAIFPLKATIWTHCSRLPHKLLRPLIDVFGLPWLAEPSETENLELCDWLLSKSVCGKIRGNKSEKNYQLIPDYELQELISVVTMRELSLSNKAGRLIRDYFVASRRARTSGGAGVEECLPIGALQTITSLAEAHARLSLRSSVQVADAVAVISLYEQTLVTMFGPAFMAPPPALSTINPKIPFHVQVDDYLSKFSDWLYQYTHALLGENEE